MEPLRNLTMKKVNEFHKRFYRWDNLSIIVVGNVPIHELLSRIAECELSDPSSAKSNPATRLERAPWMSPVPNPKIPSDVVNVKFPSYDADDDLGEVSWGWRGPEWTNFIGKDK